VIYDYGWKIIEKSFSVLLMIFLSSSRIKTAICRSDEFKEGASPLILRRRVSFSFIRVPLNKKENNIFLDSET
jgi:hypothetical protein